MIEERGKLKTADCARIQCRLPKVIWKQAASPPPVFDPLTATAHNRLTAFASWRQCARPSNTRIASTQIILKSIRNVPSPFLSVEFRW